VIRKLLPDGPDGKFGLALGMEINALGLPTVLPSPHTKQGKKDGMKLNDGTPLGVELGTRLSDGPTLGKFEGTELSDG
jgi:hypothetical protein